MTRDSQRSSFRDIAASRSSATPDDQHVGGKSRRFGRGKRRATERTADFPLQFERTDEFVVLGSRSSPSTSRCSGRRRREQFPSLVDQRVEQFEQIVDEEFHRHVVESDQRRSSTSQTDRDEHSNDPSEQLGASLRSRHQLHHLEINR